VGRLGVFLTRRQIATLRRLVVAADLPNTPEMRDLRRIMDSEHEFAEKDRQYEWGGNYEWETTNEYKQMLKSSEQ
jgi:hypothetical protein